MKQIGMIASRDFEYGGTLYVEGDRFEVAPIHAAIIMRTQNARLTTPLDAAPTEEPAEPPQTKHIEVATPKPKRPRRKRKTNRRDIPKAPVTK